MDHGIILQTKELLDKCQLAKMRAVYIDYSKEWDAQNECHAYEQQITNVQKKARNISWAGEIYDIKNTKLSPDVKKYFSMAEALTRLVKEADDITTKHNAECLLKAQDTDAEFCGFSGTLPNERIAKAREFLKKYHSLTIEVINMCRVATREAIKDFETRLEINQKENLLREKAEKFDSRFTAMEPMRREPSFFAVADALVSEIRSASPDILRFCKFATPNGANRLSDKIKAERKYLAFENKITALCSSKVHSEDWCNLVWSTYKEISSDLSHCRNAKLLEDCKKEADGIATKKHEELLAMAQNADAWFNSFVGTLSNARIAEAKEFLRKYNSLPFDAIALCKSATREAINRFELQLEKNQKENILREQAEILDSRFMAMNPLRREPSFFVTADTLISDIQSTSSDILLYCNHATRQGADALSEKIKAERKHLALEKRIDRLSQSKERSFDWCSKVWSTYKEINPDIAHCRNGQLLKTLNKDADNIYIEITCAPYLAALDTKSDFKTVFKLNDGLSELQNKDILYHGIPNFDARWSSRVSQAKKEAGIKADECFKEAERLYKNASYDNSYKLFVEAYQYGNEKAICRLGEHYYFGRAVSKDLRLAEEYFKKAANNGDLCAMSYLSDILENRKDYSQAFLWRKRAVESGNIPGDRFSLGKMYYYGNGTQTDLARARSLFEEELNANFAVYKEKAAAYLGEIYEKGFGVLQSEETAFKYYRMAPSIESAVSAAKRIGEKMEQERHQNELNETYLRAKAGDAWSQCFVGKCYYYGEGTGQSYTLAREWFERSAQQKNAEAMIYLGRIYRNGYGVPINLDRAIQYFAEAERYEKK